MSEATPVEKLTPEEAEKWVEEQMVPIYPLGVKKDIEVEPWFSSERPNFDADRVLAALGTTDSPARRFSGGLPSHLDKADVGIKMAGEIHPPG